MSRDGYSVWRDRQQAKANLAQPDFGDVVAEVWDQRQAEREHRVAPFMPWALRIPEPKTGTLDFNRFPFQRELYAGDVEHPDVGIKKPTQVGVSAYLVRWTMFWADTRGWTALYVFPKSKQLYDFSDSRIRPLVLGSDYLRERVPGHHVQNKGLKQIGLGFVYYRGSESKDDLESVDADVIALDEYDNLTPAHVPIAEQRISGSAYGYIRRVGVPSVPDFGIDRFFNESDQRRWHLKCSHCKHWQHLSFWENVDMNRALRVCAKCGKSIEDVIGKGEWVAAYPDRAKRCYHVNRLMVPGAQAKVGELIERSKRKSPYEVQNFYNRVLGEAYAPEEGRLSKQALAAATREYTMSPGYVGADVVTMGIDVASARDLNVRISVHNLDERSKGALWIGTVESFDDLARLMDRYSVRMAAIDHMPEMRLARAFAERFAGRVYLVRYAGPQTTKVLDVDDEMRVATIRRTEAIDAAATMIREQRNHLPIDRPEDYDRQMQAVIRYVERDELDRITMGYRSTGPDDFMHAETFDLIATELWHIRQEVEHHFREEMTPLDDMLEFKRAALHQNPDSAEYSPGRDLDTYSAGYEPDDDDL